MEHSCGPLLLIGGAEDKVGSRSILHRFVQLAGGRHARIVIVATASSFQELIGQRYVKLFSAMRVAHVEILHARDRIQAQQEKPLAQLQSATGIFFTGGDQLKLTAVLGGTPVAETIRQRHLHGCVVGGTSAGASAAAEHMIAYGASGIPPQKAMMQFAPGLGLLHGVVIDQHFGARGRAGRLLTAVAHNPGLLGLGLDEDTAIDIDAQGLFTVLGRGSVLIVDGTEMSYTDVHRIPEQAPLTIFGMRLHMLASGYSYNIRSRMPHFSAQPPPIPPQTEGIDGEGI